MVEQNAVHALGISHRGFVLELSRDYSLVVTDRGGAVASGSWGSQRPSVRGYIAMTPAHGRGDHRQSPLMSATL